MTVVELRQYILRPGRRDTLIELFETDLEAGQERCGMRILGTFRDLDDPQRFVWIRTFPDMEQRAASLARFYGGPVWRGLRARANATMLDSDDVLLLAPGWAQSMPSGGPSATGPDAERGVVQAGIVSFTHCIGEVDLMYFCDEIVPELESAGASVLACLVSEPAANTFPALPVREGENVLVWLAGFPDRISFDAARNLRYDLAPAIHAWPGLAGPPDFRALAPTRTSRLTGVSATAFVPVHVLSGQGGAS